MGAATEELVKLAARLAFQEFATPYRVAFERRLVGIVVCGVLAFIAGLAGVTCLVVAFWLWLAPHLGGAIAGLICAGILLLAALILALAAVRYTRHTPSASLSLADALKGKDISAAIEKHLPELLVAAAVGGLLLGLRRKK